MLSLVGSFRTVSCSRPESDSELLLEVDSEEDISEESDSLFEDIIELESSLSNESC